jgi:hypothetical protein
MMIWIIAGFTFFMAVMVAMKLAGLVLAGITHCDEEDRS